MEISLALSIGFFYLSLVSLAGIVAYRAVQWAIARKSVLNSIREKWENRKLIEQREVEKILAKDVLGSTNTLHEHSLFTEVFGNDKSSDSFEPQTEEKERYPLVMEAEEPSITSLGADFSQTESEYISTENEDLHAENFAENDWNEVQLTHEEEIQEKEKQIEANPHYELEAEHSEVHHGELTPQKIITLLRRVDALISRKDFDDAKKILIRILSWQEDHFDAGAHLAYVYLQSGDHRKAENLYRKVLEVRPRDASLLTNFALAILEQKDPMRIDDSVKAFQLAAQLDPKNSQRYANLGQSLFFAGDIPNAILAFERAVRLAPRNVELYFFLADSYLAVRNFANAKKVFAKILDLAPLNQEAKHEISELQQMGY